jgi:hypothetical protein
MEEFEKEIVEETQLEIQENEQEKKEPNGVERVETTMTWVERALEMLNKYGAKKILQGVLVIFIIIFLGIFAFKPESFFESYDAYRERTHNERMDTRNNNTPLIQAELNNLRIRYGASWVSVWELHNNTNNLDGLPFIFASLNYESMNPGLIPIAEQFDNVRLSLYPMSTYLRANEMWYGDVEELKEIDYSAYYRAKALGITYLGFKLMDIEGSPNAVLSFAFVENSELPDMKEFIQSWITTSYKINGLLSISR